MSVEAKEAHFAGAVSVGLITDGEVYTGDVHVTPSDIMHPQQILFSSLLPIADEMLQFESCGCNTCKSMIRVAESVKAIVEREQEHAGKSEH